MQNKSTTVTEYVAAVKNGTDMRGVTPKGLSRVMAEKVAGLFSPYSDGTVNYVVGYKPAEQRAVETLASMGLCTVTGVTTLGAVRTATATK